MLRIVQQQSSKAAKSYYTTADYLREEAIGLWFGKGAQLLGLQGSVTKDTFDRMCDNLHPHRDGPLTLLTRGERTVGYDFSFSAEKSVSVAYALNGDHRIVEAFQDAVNSTMGDMEAEMKTRVRKGGLDTERTTANMVWAEFIHKTSRPIEGVPDPQLHAHCFVFNSTFDAKEQAWKAGFYRDLKRDAPYWQGVFRVRLANNLRDLGYGIERKRDDFELTGVPDSVIKKFSRRTAAIAEKAAELGITDPIKKGELGAATRERKNRDLTWVELRAEWNSRLTPEEQDALGRLPGNHAAWNSADYATSAEMAVAQAIHHSFERNSVMEERRLLAEAFRFGLGRVTVDEVHRAHERAGLIRIKHEERNFVTTREVLDEESRIIRFARDGRGIFGKLGDSTREIKRDYLNAGQRKAIQEILDSRDRVILIRGVAGTGKTTMMKEAVEAVNEAGKEVIVLAPTVGASHDVLRKAGFDSADTVARFLIDEKLQSQARGQVIWVDEAGLLGNKDISRLFDIAQQQGARIVLQGDRRQHSSVSYGTPLRLLESEAGLPVAEVTQIFRQSGEYKAAVTALSEGRIADGFQMLDELNWIKEISNEERYRALAQAYVDAISQRNANGEAKSALVVSPTHAEAALITSEIRQQLQSAGKLVEEREFTSLAPLNLTEAERGDAVHLQQGDVLQFHKHAPGIKAGERVTISDAAIAPLAYASRFQAYRPQRLKIAIGDKLRLTANGKTKDGKRRLANGSLHAVKGFTRGGDIITTDDIVIGRGFGHFAHGYVVTSYASQGKTVDQVIIGQSNLSAPASNQAQWYVSVSRGREKAIVFTDSKGELLEAVQRTPAEWSATELLKSKQSAHNHRLKKLLDFQRKQASFEAILAQSRQARTPQPSLQPELS